VLIFARSPGRRFAHEMARFRAKNLTVTIEEKEVLHSALPFPQHFSSAHLAVHFEIINNSCMDCGLQPSSYLGNPGRSSRETADRLLRTVALSAFLVFLGLVPSAGTCDSAKDNYPAIISDSPDRRASAEREWRRMLDSYNVPQTPPDFYPIIYTPRSLLGVPGGVKIAATRAVDETEEMATREAAKSFLTRWKDLLGIDPAGISLTSVTNSAGSLRFEYAQANYPFPIIGNYGQLTMAISAEGRLSRLDDRLIPVVDLPSRPSLDREGAIRKVIGKTFRSTDSTGREQQTSVTDRTQVEVKQLAVVPVDRGDAIEIHLAWEINVGKSPVWVFYIDAFNGQELKTAHIGQG
jgi:hypothetical protein